MTLTDRRRLIRKCLLGCTLDRYAGRTMMLPSAARCHSSSAARPFRLSRMLTPTAKSTTTAPADVAISHELLLRAGFIRQSSAGMYSFLPLGLRVLAKLEKLIDREMQSVDGQKVALPCLLPSDGWKRTGRWESTGAEMFKVHDRKGSEFCLAPTHEEEITQLVASEKLSWRQLPLRLYQIGRKYRDEARPRSGLLRAREFVMKDMYSFDVSEEAALKTYEEVRGAYDRILSALGIPFAAAEADTGNIGGTRSHEYHFLSNAGEDTVLLCKQCGYTANEERATGIIKRESEHNGCVVVVLSDPSENPPTKRRAVISLAHRRSVNPTKLKQHPLLKGLNMSFPNGLKAESSTAEQPGDLVFTDVEVAKRKAVPDDVSSAHTGDFVTIEPGDGCSACSTHSPSPLESHRAIEIGHTFLLGAKYSSALGATIRNDRNEVVPMQMGCFGIGVTRAMAAIVEASNDSEGIIWPPAIAPFAACLVPFVNRKSGAQEQADVEQGVEAACEALLVSDVGGEGGVVIDDRDTVSFGFKMKDAALVGYPAVVVVGKRYLAERLLEVHDRRTGAVRYVTADELALGK
ncbi:prolyl-tRNA synthetase [Geranomyces variabilis]|nr:prolyl-tRNA synthetase [Geranomyces variabilis]